jgi:hypothetical protein
MDYKIMHDKKNRPKLEKDGVAIVATLQKLGIDRMEVNYLSSISSLCIEFIYLFFEWMNVFILQDAKYT